MVDKNGNATAAPYLGCDGDVVGETDLDEFTSRRTIVQRLGNPAGDRIPGAARLLGLGRERPETVGIHQLCDHRTRTPQIFDGRTQRPVRSLLPRRDDGDHGGRMMPGEPCRDGVEVSQRGTDARRRRRLQRIRDRRPVR